MSNTSNNKGYKRFYPWLKWIFSAISIYFFVQQIKGQTDVFGQIVQTLADNKGLSILIFGLAFLNWNLEAQKFKLLLSNETNLGDVKAFFTILSGMAISNFTPARTGEYIGRSLVLKYVNPIKVVIATIAGNIAQVLMTYAIGFISLLIVVFFTDLGGGLLISNRIYVGLGFCLLLVLVLLNAKKWLLKLKKILPSKVAKSLNIIKKYDKNMYLKVVGLAFSRYLAFSFQFYLLLQMFSGFALSAGAILLIPIAYLMQSLAPVPAITDVGVRVAVSQFLFAAYMPDYQIVLTVTCLWFINLILPGIIGTVYLLISTIGKK